MREKEIHTKKTRSHVWHHPVPSSGPLRSLPQCRMMFLCLPGGTWLFLSPASAKQESKLQQNHLLPGQVIGFAVVGCIPVLLGVIIGIFTFRQLQLPATFLFPALHSSSPMGPAPLAEPKTLRMRLLIPSQTVAPYFSIPQNLVQSSRT